MRTAPDDRPPDDVVGAGAVAWDHSVHFYEQDDALCASIAGRFAEGLAEGDTVVALCTRPHRDALIEHLDEAGFDWEAARRAGRIRWMDAREALELVMMGREPDRRNFDQYVGEAIRDAVDRGDGIRVRVYGELVDLLWQEGFEEAALRVEDMWNDLGRSRSFSLLCAYATGSAHQENGKRPYQAVCDRHARVLSPVELAQR